MSYRLCTIWSS